MSSSLLANLLWWLAERRTRVLAVMTTNNRAKLPPELYREGRIDEAMSFEGLAVHEVKAFAERLLATFDVPGLDKAKLTIAVGQMFKKTCAGDTPRTSHAAVTKRVYNLVKSSVSSGSH